MGLQEYVRNGMTKAMGAISALNARMESMEKVLEDLSERPRTIQEEIDAIEGRRLDYRLVGTQDFTIAQDGLRANFINLQVAQDGPFIWTYAPICMWKPTAPANTPLLNCWRPVYTWPMPFQASDAAGPGATIDFNLDMVSISYEIMDSGGSRNFQNAARPPDFSIPGNLVPLATPTLFTPNTTVQFYPTYDRILFNSTSNTPTAGQLVVALPGFKIVNM